MPFEDEHAVENTQQTPLPETMALPKNQVSELETILLQQASVPSTELPAVEQENTKTPSEIDPSSMETEIVKLPKKTSSSFAKLALWGGISIFGIGTAIAIVLISM